MPPLRRGRGRHMEDVASRGYRNQVRKVLTSMRARMTDLAQNDEMAECALCLRHCILHESNAYLCIIKKSAYAKQKDWAANFREEAVVDKTPQAKAEKIPECLGIAHLLPAMSTHAIRDAAVRLRDRVLKALETNPTHKSVTKEDKALMRALMRWCRSWLKGS